jgi:hypothetical protein
VVWYACFLGHSCYSASSRSQVRRPRITAIIPGQADLASSPIVPASTHVLWRCLCPPPLCSALLPACHSAEPTPTSAPMAASPNPPRNISLQNHHQQTSLPAYLKTNSRPIHPSRKISPFPYIPLKWSPSHHTSAAHVPSLALSSRFSLNKSKSGNDTYPSLCWIHSSQLTLLSSGLQLLDDTPSGLLMLRRGELALEATLARTVVASDGDERVDVSGLVVCECWRLRHGGVIREGVRGKCFGAAILFCGCRCCGRQWWWLARWMNLLSGCEVDQDDVADEGDGLCRK